MRKLLKSSNRKSRKNKVLSLLNTLIFFRSYIISLKEVVMEKIFKKRTRILPEVVFILLDRRIYGRVIFNQGFSMSPVSEAILKRLQDLKSSEDIGVSFLRNPPISFTEQVMGGTTIFIFEIKFKEGNCVVRIPYEESQQTVVETPVIKVCLDNSDVLVFALKERFKFEMR